FPEQAHAQHILISEEEVLVLGGLQVEVLLAQVCQHHLRHRQHVAGSRNQDGRLAILGNGESLSARLEALGLQRRRDDLSRHAHEFTSREKERRRRKRPPAWAPAWKHTWAIRIDHVNVGAQWI